MSYHVHYKKGSGAVMYHGIFGHTQIRKGASASFEFADLVVDAAGDGDYTTLQDAEDNAAANCVIYVKEGTYAAGVTIDTGPCKWIFETGCIVQGEIQVDTTKVALEFQPGCDVQDIIDINSADCWVAAMNGLDIDGIDCSSTDSDRQYINGGGWGTVSDGGGSNTALRTDGDDALCLNLAIDQASGATTFGNPQGARDVFSGVKCISTSSVGGERASVNAADWLELGCFMAASGGNGNKLQSTAHRARIVGNYIGTGVNNSDGLLMASGADDEVVVGNVIDNGAGSGVSIDIASGSTDKAIVGNRLGDTPSDGDGSSILSSNDLTGF